MSDKYVYTIYISNKICVEVEIIVKVKEPQMDEVKLIKENQIRKIDEKKREYIVTKYISFNYHISIKFHIIQ